MFNFSLYATNKTYTNSYTKIGVYLKKKKKNLNIIKLNKSL